MSKLTKLIFHPLRFIEDGIKKNVKKPEPKPIGKSVSKPKATSDPKGLTASNSQSSMKITLTLQAATGAMPLPVSDCQLSFKIILQTGENAQTGKAHLALWIPQFLASDESFLVVVRNEELFNVVRANYPTLAVVYAKTAVDVENLLQLMPQLKAVFYTSNTGNNIHFLRFNHINHIFIGHGDSEKFASAHKFFRVYDQIWVAGQAHIDRFANAQFDARHISFVKVGRPNLRSVMAQLDVPWRMRLKQPTALYLPTWEGTYEDSYYSSIQHASEFLAALHKQTGIALNAKLHPDTGKRVIKFKEGEKYLSQTLKAHDVIIHIYERKFPVEQLFYQSNIFICDISAVITECLSASSPLFVYIPSGRAIKLANSAMPFNEYAYTFSSPEELVQKVKAVLEDGDVLAEKRALAIDYFAGKEQTLSGEFQKQLKAIAADTCPAPAQGLVPSLEAQHA